MSNILKGLFCGLLLIALMFSLCACSSQGNSVTLKEGVSLSDIMEEIDNQIGLQMSGDITDDILIDIYGLDMNDVEAYSGKMSMTMTSSDTVIGIKAVPGKINNIVAGLEKRQQDIISSFSSYLPEQLAKAQAGKIIVKGDYAFLIIVGQSEASINEDLTTVQSIINSYFT